MNFFSRFINRLRFSKTVKSDQGINVVDSMVKARKLYKELCIKTHPDKHQVQQGIAEELMKKVVVNKFNYNGLLQLQIEIKEKLGV